MAPQRTTQQHLDALKTVSDALEPLSPEMRRRILRAVAIMLDIDTTGSEPAPVESP